MALQSCKLSAGNARSHQSCTLPASAVGGHAILRRVCSTLQTMRRPNLHSLCSIQRAALRNGEANAAPIALAVGLKERQCLRKSSYRRHAPMYRIVRKQRCPWDRDLRGGSDRGMRICPVTFSLRTAVGSRVFAKLFPRPDQVRRSV